MRASSSPFAILARRASSARTSGRHASTDSSTNSSRKLKIWASRNPPLIPNLSKVRPPSLFSELQHEQYDQSDDQRVDGDGFRKDDTENHVGLDEASSVRVATHR